jgi:hypothetical protein
MLVAAGASTAEAQISVIASWDPNPDSYTVGYRVYYGTAPGNYQTNVDTGSAVSVTLSLAPGNVYYFIVRGYNVNAVLGPPSQEASIDLRTEPTAQITATLGANNVATVTWQTSNAASATMTWETVSPVTTTINQNPVALSGTMTAAVTAPTTFTLWATASDGRIATASAAVTPTAPTTSPGRRLRSPTAFRLTWTGITATLSWVSSSVVTEADALINYVLEVGTAPGESNVAKLNVGNRTTFTTEVPFGTYYVRVRAENADGESSDPSAEIEVRAPGAPQEPTDLRSVSASDAVDLRWTAPSGGDAPTGYIIEAGSGPGLSDIARVQVRDMTHYTTTAPPGEYYVRIRAINAGGTSAPSNEIVVRR